MFFVTLCCNVIKIYAVTIITLQIPLQYFFVSLFGHFSVTLDTYAGNSNKAIIEHILPRLLHSLKLIIVTTNNFIADTITKNTWKNLIGVRIIDKIQAKIKHCRNDSKNTCRKQSLLQ
jgi:hypothetical protein